MRIMTTRMHDFRHSAAIGRLLLILNSQSVDIGPHSHPPSSVLLATLNDDAANFGTHANGQALPIEQLIEPQAGLQFRAARLRMGVHLTPQRNHLLEGVVDSCIYSASPIGSHKQPVARLTSRTRARPAPEGCQRRALGLEI